MRNLNTSFKLNGKPITYKEYLIRGVAKTVKDKLLKYTTDSESQIKYCGYGLSDLKKVDLEAYLRKYIEYYFNRIMEYYKTGNRDFIIEVPFKNGKIKINGSRLEDARKEQVKFMSQNSKRFREDLTTRIRRTAPSEGIDSSNYSCE